MAESLAQYDGLEGINLVDLLKSQKLLKRDALYTYRSYSQRYAFILTSDHWKLMAYRDRSYELYKVDKDISQEYDLAAKHPKKIKSLAEKLKKGNRSPLKEM